MDQTLSIWLDKVVHLARQGRTLAEVVKIKRGKELVNIGAYCLMPNHFHLLLQEKEDGGISRFMQKLLTGYTMYFNKRQDRTGALFQGKFQSRHVDEDNYLKYLVAYIHLNPVKLIDTKWKENGISNRERAEKYLEEYSYSTYPEYTGKDRVEKAIIERDSLPDYFETVKSFKSNIKDWLNFKVEP